MARNVIDVEEVVAAGEAVKATGGDVEIARSESNNNRDQVVAAADEIIASKARVEAFIQQLIDAVGKAEAQVESTDWDSQSQRNFQAEINRFTTEVRTLGASYTASYEESLAAVRNIQSAVAELDQRFSTVCSNFIPVLTSNGEKVIAHARDMGDRADRGLSLS